MKRVFVITAGRGPVECRRAVKAVLSAFVMAIEEIGLEADLVPGADPDGEGPFSCRVLIHDDGRLAAVLPGWLGSVQYVARSDRRSKADRKNWFVGIREEATDQSVAPLVAVEDVDFSAMAAGGPGGQHVNKTASAVRAVHRPTGVTVVVRSERSQHRNKAIAMERLAEALAALIRQDREVAERSEWSGRILVERGNPVRVLRA